MSSSSSPRTPRRKFLGELAASAAALAAATACTPAATATSAGSQAPTPTPGPTPPQSPAATPNQAPAAPQIPIPPQTWDASWMERITAPHKAVFDSPEIGDGTALWQAMSYLRSVKDVFGTGDSDASVVVVLRHAAVPMLYNDAMWAKYNIGTETKTNDQKTKQPATRNIYYQNLDAQGNPVSDERPTPTIRSLSARGVIFIGCDLATRGFSSRFARATNQQMATVYAEVKENLVPGAILMPTGIFGMLLAQEKGCSFMKST